MSECGMDLMERAKIEEMFKAISAYGQSPIYAYLAFRALAPSSFTTSNYESDNSLLSIHHGHIFAQVNRGVVHQEGDGVVAVSAFGFIFVLDELEDEREIDRFKKNFKRVVLWNKVSDGEVDKGELSVFFHDFSPFCSPKDTEGWGYEQGGGGNKIALSQHVGNYLTGSGNLKRRYFYGIHSKNLGRCKG